MKCIETTELIEFIKGKLSPQQMIAVDEHISNCPNCKAAVKSLISSPVSKLGADILEVTDCPEYEELSAYVDDALQADNAHKITAHINNCELCFRDVTQIRELRSKAALRDKIVVTPGATRQRSRTWFPVWQRVLAGAAVAGVAAVFAISNINPGNIPTPGNAVVATNPGTSKPNTVESTKPGNNNSEAANSVNTPGNNQDKPAVNNTRPTPANTAAKPNVVLKDGRYQVIKQNGSYVVADAAGKPAASAGLAAKIAEKLSTGGVKAAKSASLAVTAISTRGNNQGYNPPPTAPKLVGPMGRIIATNTPTFKWSAVDLAHAYQLMVTDEDGNVVYSGTTSRTSLTVTPLARGKVYTWRVGVKFNENDDWTYSSAAKFSIISTDAAREINNVKRDMPGSHLALAVTYESFGLKNEAAHEYSLCRKSNTSSDYSHKLTVK